MSDDPSFRVIRSNGTDEVLARAVNLLIARCAYRETARMYPDELLLRCRQCGGHGALAKLIGLSHFPPCDCGFEMKKRPADMTGRE
jgi:hypothetical protein